MTEHQKTEHQHQHQHQHHLTGSWALNALDADERARVEEYLAQDPVAAAEARSFQETAGELARSLDPVVPRADLKNSVMARVAQTRQLPPHPAPVADDAPADSPAGVGEVVPLDRYRSSVRRTRWLGVAAALLMVTTVSGIGLWGVERAAQEDAQVTIEALRSEESGAEHEREMVSTIMAADDAAHMTVPTQSGQGSLHLMYSREQGSMIIQATELPQLPGDSQYQLWIMDDGEAHSAGMISEADQTLMMHAEMPPTSSIGLTIEPMGGSEQPTSAPIARGEL